MASPAPQRRATRAPHLSVAAVPVERALLARAENPGDTTSAARRIARMHGIDDRRLTEAIAAMIRELMADQFRSLAEELHWW